MTEKPLVSVIINCYNSEKYLRETIDSVLDQRYTNYEVIFWDNCSTDSTADIILSYKDPRFKYYRAEKTTPLGEARNFALDRVTGDYIAFLDSDDVWLKNYLERAVMYMEGGEYVLYYSNYYNWIDSDLLVVFNRDTISHPMSFENFISNYMVGMSSSLIRTEHLRQNDLRFKKEYRLVEDYDLFLKLVYGHTAFYDSEPLMKYRMHSESQTLQTKSSWIEEFRLMYFDLKDNLLVNLSDKQKKSTLKPISFKIAKYEIEECIDRGDRRSVFKLVFQNLHISFVFLFYLLNIIVPTKSVYRIKSILKRNGYRTA